MQGSHCLIIHSILYSRIFSSAKNFVKSDRQAVRRNFFRQKSAVARLLFVRSVVALLLIVSLPIHEYFCANMQHSWFFEIFSQEFNYVKKLL